MPKPMDFTPYIGQRFGGYTVVGPARNFNHQMKVRCICDCGTESWCSMPNLRQNKAGCKKCTRRAAIRARTRQYAAKTPKLAACRRVRERYQQRSAKIGIEFSLTKEQFYDLMYQPCYYCGDEGSNKWVLTQPLDFAGAEVRYNGIDRIDNAKGYTIDNCVPCCWWCNAAKNDRSADEFLRWTVHVAARAYNRGYR